MEQKMSIHVDTAAKPTKRFRPFMDFVEFEPYSGCWLWSGAWSDNGYGKKAIRKDGKKITGIAHRVSYELHKGPIPEGLDLDHLCRTRCCVNPNHLEPVTRRVNLIRGIGPAKVRQMCAAITHCKQGHEFTAENTHVYVDHKGYRSRACRICRRASGVRHYWKSKAIKSEP